MFQVSGLVPILLQTNATASVLPAELSFVFVDGNGNGNGNGNVVTSVMSVETAILICSV